MGTWDCGQADVAFTADKISWMPAEGHGLPGTGGYVLISIPISMVTRFEVDKKMGGMAIWAIHDPPFDVAEFWDPMGDATKAKSSIFIEWDPATFRKDNIAWPKQIMHLCRKLKMLARFTGPGEITGRRIRHPKPVNPPGIPLHAAARPNSSAAGASSEGNPAQDVANGKVIAKLNDEIVELKAQLREQEEARKAAEAKLASEAATRHVTVRQRAREEASSRHAAASAWEHLAKVEAASVLPASVVDVDAIDNDAFMARYLAFRQHVEMLLMYVPAKTALSRPWKLRVRRTELCRDVIRYFGEFSKMKLFQPTQVSFVDAHGVEEEGVDQGGLTEEMYSSFFSEVLLSDVGIFEGARERDMGEADGGDAEDAGNGGSSGHISIGLLPAPTASPSDLRAVGRAMCKCVLADRPIGRGLGRFVFEYLVDAHERRVFHEPLAALKALADYDPDLAHRWSQLLANPVDGLTLDLFDSGAADEDVPAEREAIGRAILAGCRYKLLGSRRASLEALRQGFADQTLHGIDLTMQLAALSSAELLLMMRGKTQMSSADLIDCFDWPVPGSMSAVQAGFEAVGSNVPQLLREIFLDESDETALTSEQRLAVLEWCTALTALPCGGLKEKIKLELWEDGDDNDLPSVHTCTHDVHLPAYHSRETLRAKLLMAVEHRHDGFQME